MSKAMAAPLRYWWRLRAWWHANLYHPAEITLTEDGFLVECSCGGHGQVARNGDGTFTVTAATCLLWKWRLQCKPILPGARAMVRP